MRNFFYYLISFILSVFFMAVGAIALILPWSTTTQEALIHLILKDSVALSLFGCALVVIGLSVIINIGLNTRRRHYYIRSGSNAILVNEAVIQRYLEVYWKQLFPENDIPFTFLLKKNKIHISVDLPYLPMEEQKELLERIRKDLRATFAKVLDYREEFYIAATFQSKKTN
ncbi:MAG: hypothetical protein WCF65_02655 [Parachlamydiaceae bacterium]